jgi:hypothetical protein
VAPHIDDPNYVGRHRLEQGELKGKKYTTLSKNQLQQKGLEVWFKE